MKIKRPKTKLIVITVSFFFLLILAGVLFVNNKKSSADSPQTDTTISLEDIAEKTIISDDVVPGNNSPAINEPPSQEITLGGWIAYWDFNSALVTYKANNNSISSLSPTWYFQQPDGTLGLKNTARNPELIKLCQTNGTKLVPSISNSDAGSLSIILNDPALAEKHIQAIVNESVTYEYDGIDIDYEAIKSSDKDTFTEFIRLLSDELHSHGKILSIAILWKNDLDGVIDIVSESRAAQDWEMLGSYADEFRIMAYDYTGSGDKAGPIAPYEWIRSIIEYAIKHVDINKIVLALPLYAYDWIEEKAGAKALTWVDVRKVQNPTSDILDPDFREKKLSYTTNGIIRIVWYQDSDATKKRVELAKTYGIFDFYFWRLGGEDPAIFQLK